MLLSTTSPYSFSQVAADVSEEAVDPIVIAAVTVNQYIYVVLNMLKIQN